MERHFALDSVEIAGDEYPADDPKGTAILLHGGGQTRHSCPPSAAGSSRARAARIAWSAQSGLRRATWRRSTITS
jgi:hypothetical protein